MIQKQRFGMNFFVLALGIEPRFKKDSVGLGSQDIVTAGAACVIDVFPRMLF